MVFSFDTLGYHCQSGGLGLCIATDDGSGFHGRCDFYCYSIAIVVSFITMVALRLCWSIRDDRESIALYNSIFGRWHRDSKRSEAGAFGSPRYFNLLAYAHTMEWKDHGCLYQRSWWLTWVSAFGNLEASCK